MGGSPTARLDDNRFKRFSACSVNPDVEVPKATFELYPNNMILERGIRSGRKSLNHNFPSLVHVVLAWFGRSRGFRPCTAIILDVVHEMSWRVICCLVRAALTRCPDFLPRIISQENSGAWHTVAVAETICEKMGTWHLDQHRQMFVHTGSDRGNSFLSISANFVKVSGKKRNCNNPDFVESGISVLRRSHPFLFYL